MQTINLPDFDDLFSISEQLRDALIARDFLEQEIKARESEIYRLCNTDNRYFVAGKPPSVSYIKAAYEFSGLDGELLEKRKALSKASALVDSLRLKFDVMKMQVDLYRTESANRRNSTL